MARGYNLWAKIMDYASLLNDKQYAAVSSTAQFVRVIAGAGSGKTRVLTYRIAYLISELHVDPSRILAFTFTNKAAGEMSERAAKLVSEITGGSRPNLHISTFHSFCARFLRAEHQYLTYKKETKRILFNEATGEEVEDFQEANASYPIGFTIYSDDDQARLVKSIAPDLGYKKGDDVVKRALAYIRKKKMKGLYPDDINPNNSLYEDEKISYKFFAEYEKRKTQNIALDFDDLICKTLKILEDYPEVRDAWSRRFDYMLVDEFQDTDDTQMKLMKLLLRDDSHLFVVGDPDQTIYTWRGANQAIIVDFENRFPGAETIILDENYRSTKVILDAANRLIANNKKRVPKNLFTRAPGGEAISVKQTGTPEREAEWVAGEIQKIANKQRNEEGNPLYSNIAILYRSSYLTRPFESELKDRGIPYRIFGGLRFYERMEVKDLLAYFSLLTNPLDNVSFERIVNVPKRGIGETTLERIHNEATLAHLSEYEYIHQIDDFPNTKVSTKAINTLRDLMLEMEKTKHQMSENTGETFASVLKEFTKNIGYFDYLAETEDPDEDRIKNVNALFDDINHFIEKNPDSSFEQYLQNVTLLTSQDDMNGGNYVSLMTIHVAKGLEFDYVFIIGMNEGAFPSARAEAETGRDGTEEERRLAYVAFTRAKKRLYLSTNTSYSYVTDSHSIPSSYFKEAGIEVPHDEYHVGNGWHSWGSSRPSNYGQRKGNSSFAPSFFSDGDSISPFEETKKEKPQQETKPKATNGVTDWQLGDRVCHEVFGEGTVTDIIDKSIIVIQFDEVGKKTLLASHPKLKRISKKGGVA